MREAFEKEPAMPFQNAVASSQIIQCQERYRGGITRAGRRSDRTSRGRHGDLPSSLAEEGSLALSTWSATHGLSPRFLGETHIPPQVIFWLTTDLDGWSLGWPGLITPERRTSHTGLGRCGRVSGAYPHRIDPTKSNTPWPSSGSRQIMSGVWSA